MHLMQAEDHTPDDLVALPVQRIAVWQICTARHGQRNAAMRPGTFEELLRHDYPDLSGTLEGILPSKGDFTVRHSGAADASHERSGAARCDAITHLEVI